MLVELPAQHSRGETEKKTLRNFNEDDWQRSSNKLFLTSADTKLTTISIRPRGFIVGGKRIYVAVHVHKDSYPNNKFFDKSHIIKILWRKSNFTNRRR